MYSVEVLPDSVQIQLRETVSGVFLVRKDIPVQVWHMVEVMRKDFIQYNMTQVHVKENKLVSMLEWLLTLAMRLNHSISSSFLGKRSTTSRDSHHIRQKSGLLTSETMTFPAPQQPQQPQKTLCSAENFQISSADSSWLFDFCLLKIFWYPISFLNLIIFFNFNLIMRIDRKLRS